MARPLRIQYDGAVYHVTARGNERKPVFRDDEDRRALLDVLQVACERYNWLCHAYCLMTNHYHLVIESVDGNLSSGMRHLNGTYTQRFNRRYDRAGHLFQGRFKAILIEKQSHLLEVSRYVVLNPVRARLVKHPSEWPWSSYNATCGRQAAHASLSVDWILSQFAERRRVAQRKYEQYVEEGIGGVSIWRAVSSPGILGSQEFVRSLEPYVRGQQQIPEIPRRQRFVNRPGLSEVFSDSAVAVKADRNRAIRIAIEQHGYRQTEIAKHLGLHYSTVSRLLAGEMSKCKT